MRRVVSCSAAPVAGMLREKYPEQPAKSSSMQALETCATLPIMARMILRKRATAENKIRMDSSGAAARKRTLWDIERVAR